MYLFDLNKSKGIKDIILISKPIQEISQDSDDITKIKENRRNNINNKKEGWRII